MATTTAAAEFGRGKTIGVLALVVGCFAVLWPKLFYPMFSGRSGHEARPSMDPGQFRKGERPPFIHPGMLNPGMRERAQVPHGIHHPGEVPPRPADLAGKPSLGGPGQYIPPQKPGGTMGMIMPIYTLAIVVFFVYTVMKIMFKKDEEPAKERRLEILDPEHRRSEELRSVAGKTVRVNALIQEYESSGPGCIEAWKDRDERDETPMKIEDVEIENLRQRLADTEAAMQRMMATISTVSDRLTNTAKAADIVLPPPPPPVARQKSPSVAKEEEELAREKADRQDTEAEEKAEDSEQTPQPDPEPEPQAIAEPERPLEAAEVKEKTSKPSPTLARKHIHFSESTQIGVRDVQTAAEFPRRSRSRSKERLLDSDDITGADEDVSNIVLDAALRRDTQLIVSEAECKALPLEDQEPMVMDASAEADDMTPVVLSGKMTISFLGGNDGLSVDVPEGHHRAHDFDADHPVPSRRKLGGHQSYMREESDPGPGGRDKGRRTRKWAGQKKIRKRRSSTPTSTRSLDEDDEVGDERDGSKPISGEDPNADSSIMDNVPELPDDDGDVDDPDAEDATSAGDENLTGRSKLREESVEYH